MMMSGWYTYTYILPSTGPPTVPNTLNVDVTISLSLLLSWQPSQARNIKYELTASTTDTMNSSVNIVLTATSYVFNASSSIERCIEYVFTVRAFNLAGSSNSSDTIMAILPDGEVLECSFTDRCNKHWFVVKYIVISILIRSW